MSSTLQSLRPGTQVVVNPTYYCGCCRACRRDMAAHCTAKRGWEIGVDRDGTFADYVVVPERFAHPLHLFVTALGLAADLPLESLVTHALPLHGYGEAFAALNVPTGDIPFAASRSYAAMKVLLVPDDRWVADGAMAGL